jgi:2'-5' RNA ligase
VEKKAPSKARLFVALELPDEARSAIVGWQGHVFGGYGRDVRLVRPASLHVTLVFLGHHPEEEIDPIAEAAFSRLGRAESPELTPAALKPVPPRRPRLWAIDLSDQAARATAVHEAVAAPLVEGGWYEPEKRPFWPHITVARLRAHARAPRVEADPPEVGAFRTPEVVLYRSRLSRAGADYQAVARLRLP